MRPDYPTSPAKANQDCEYRRTRWCPEQESMAGPSDLHEKSTTRRTRRS